MKRRKKEKSAVLIRLKLLRLRRGELETRGIEELEMRGLGAGRSLYTDRQETDYYRQQRDSSRHDRDSKRQETERSSQQTERGPDRGRMMSKEAFSQRWVTLI